MRFVKNVCTQILILLVAILLFGKVSVYADDPTPTPTPGASSQTSSVADCADNHISVADCPKYIEEKLSGLQGQDKTLSSQIGIMENQVKLTQARIQDTEEQISNLEKDISIAKNKVSGLEQDISSSTKVLIARIAAVYQVGRIAPWQIFLASSNVKDVLNRLKYLRIVQVYDKRKVYAAEQTKNDYTNQKAIYEDKQVQAEALSKKLTDYTVQLDSQKKEKQTLLTQTQGNEANYERLLRQAQAQLAGFSNFTANFGGSSLLSGQTSCDDWGCYYNQRDTQWGGMALNGTQYTIASDGCLVTSMAMIFTHYGHRGVTPVSINSNSSNFASYYPAYLLYTVHADGATASRIGAALDSTLSSGDPVVVGIHAYGGTHFVVIKGGSNGNYLMRDPYIPNGKDINFTDHYSVGSIYEIDRVSVN